MTTVEPRGAIAFAERVLELIDATRRTATYKYAVLLALIDLCLERTQQSGAAPDVLTTRQVADKIVERYWLHTLPFAAKTSARVLLQNTRGQVEIVTDITRFRERHAPDPSVPIWESRAAAPAAFEQLVRRIEWKLIEMPLPRLQMVGHGYDPFIYEIHWNDQIQRRDVASYLAGKEAGGFDNRLMLRPGVGEYLRQLSGILRPVIERRWAAMVAQLNGLEESQLDDFLFGADRIQTTKIRAGLWEIQQRQCFYCEARVSDPTGGHVDHFIPWSRYPDNGLDNLVVAHDRCNEFKSNSLPASEHVSRWARRFAQGSTDETQIAALANQTDWGRYDGRSLGVARGIYGRLPADAKLWLREREFVLPDRSVLEVALDMASAVSNSRH